MTDERMTPERAAEIRTLHVIVPAQYGRHAHHQRIMCIVGAIAAGMVRSPLVVIEVEESIHVSHPRLVWGAVQDK